MASQSDILKRAIKVSYSRNYWIRKDIGGLNPKRGSLKNLSRGRWKFLEEGEEYSIRKGVDREGHIWGKRGFKGCK